MTRIAIIGGSATGKSAVARHLASSRGTRVRHCGEEVKRLAHARGVSLPALADDDHRAVDLETQRFVEQSVPLVVEGRYLHFALATSRVAGTLKVVELTAAIEARLERLERRSGTPASVDDIRASDQSDAMFTSRFFSGVVPLTRTQIDTTAMDEQQVVAEILHMLT